ncbi:SHOCT domain-containing protein [Cellulomonas hominis]|uniref:SHOCT domain-containing protein n=1 Tax=Cellulomonas hominis TaxID=156981 RepID=UPI001C0F76A7|nr:SHOCT domain-containing protein [Cellulomonas hominis]MBU5421839.1 SHOCT domain-containing protein [Cellulomonas hominis]
MSTPVTDPPTLPGTRRRTLVHLLLVAGLGALAWWLLRLGAHDATLVRWECAAGTCATDDFAGAGYPLGGMVLAGTGAALYNLARGATPGLVVALGAGALRSGWTGAVADGLNTPEAVRWRVLVVTVLLVAGLLWAVVGGLRSARRSGLTARVAGLTGTWARVRDYEDVGGTRCRATVHFADAAGVRHAVRTEVPREAFKQTPRAYYDPLRPDDPERLRVVVPALPPTAAGRRAREAAVRLALPLPDDDAPDGRPAGESASAPGPDTGPGESVVDELERLHALHAAGALTPQEYARAKSRVLDPRSR